MAQTLKEDTRKAIIQSALTIFAQKGYRDTSMQDVSRLAGLSTGNLYRYFPDKRALYSAALPPELLGKLQAALDRKIAGWAGAPLAEDPETSPAEARFRGELIDLLVENRLQWVVLLREGMAETLSDRLTTFFTRWLGTLRAPVELDDTRLMTVRSMYRNLINLFTAVLGENADQAGLSQALENCIDYHMAGLRAVMAKWSVR